MARASAEKLAATPVTPALLRQQLAGRLVKRAYQIGRGDERIGRERLARIARIHPATLTALTSGFMVGEDTWVFVARALEWGNFLDYVRSGNIAAVERCTGIDLSIQELAIESLRQIETTQRNS